MANNLLLPNSKDCVILHPRKPRKSIGSQCVSGKNINLLPVLEGIVLINWLLLNEETV